MPKAAIIYDLDNTVYDVPTVGDQLFTPLFALLAASDLPTAELPLIRQAIMRQPFQVVAARYQFGSALTRQGSEMLQALEYAGPLAPYSYWAAVRQLPGQRYLVTTGYTRLQQSKIRVLGVAADFVGIHIVDPTMASRTKRDVIRRDYASPRLPAGAGAGGGRRPGIGATRGPRTGHQLRALRPLCLASGGFGNQYHPPLC